MNDGIETMMKDFHLKLAFILVINRDGIKLNKKTNDGIFSESKDFRELWVTLMGLLSGR
jgi:hypothetical protein